jgi:hypothetical protein
MKQATIEQFVQDPQGYVRSAQQEHVLVLSNGKPLAMLVGLENKDEEDFRLEASPEFWRMIEASRREATVPLRAIEAELFADDTGEPSPEGQ